LRLTSTKAIGTFFDDFGNEVHALERDLATGAMKVMSPIVDAGANQTITLPNNTVTLSGSATDDGLPNSTLTYSWVKYSGPAAATGTVTFSNPTSKNTTATFSAAGTYHLHLTANDGQYSGMDRVTIVVNASTSNVPPTSNAGPDLSLTWPNSATLNGTVSADAVTTTWSKVSGPGTVTFANASAVDTTASFSVAGTYVVRLTANDGEFSATDDATITLNSTSTVPATPSSLSATGISSTQIQLSWTDQSSNESGFAIERGTTSSGPFTQIGSVDVNVTSFTNSGLPASTTYFYRVRAYNSMGNSAYTSVASGTTNPTVTSVAGAVGAGMAHSVAVRSDGTAWAWGLNDYGQLGVMGSPQLQRVQVPGISSVMEIAAGRSHTVALKTDGTVWTWGYNGYRQLGVTGISQRTTPLAVSGLSGIVGIAGGAYHTVALKNDGSVWSWGSGSLGELGNGLTTAYTEIPKRASLSGVVQEVSAKGLFTLALRSDGTVWAWGQNRYGQLGNGSTNNAALPIQVSGLTGITRIAAGYYHSLALKGDGTVWGWGLNNFGQVGNGTIVSQLTPVQVVGLSNVMEIGCGWQHSMALKSDQTVWVWGENSTGQLGDGTVARRTTPIRLGTLSSLIGLSAGRGHSLVLRNDGLVFGTGANESGQLGNQTTNSTMTAISTSNLDLIVP
jgi:alpha-tubulin suppressor-like RCC1 family protein